MSNGKVHSSETTGDASMEEEDIRDYTEGGYHPVQVGDAFQEGRYLIVRKLGWGHFSTVWLSKDTLSTGYVALKVVRSASHYTETALDEVKLLEKIVVASPLHPGRTHVVSLLNTFRHIGPNGSHVCMVFEVLGENLLGLIRRWNHRGIPIPLVKQISHQVLLALDYMHRKCGIIHTDLKPENVLIVVDDVEKMIEKESNTTEEISSVGERGPGKRRRETLVTGSQPLPSPISTTFPLEVEEDSRRKATSQIRYDFADFAG